MLETSRIIAIRGGCRTALKTIPLAGLLLPTTDFRLVACDIRGDRDAGITSTTITFGQERGTLHNAYYLYPSRKSASKPRFTAAGPSCGRSVNNRIDSTFFLFHAVSTPEANASWQQYMQCGQCATRFSNGSTPSTLNFCGTCAVQQYTY